MASGTEASHVTHVTGDGPVLTPAHDRPCVRFIVHGESVMASPGESDRMSSATGESVPEDVFTKVGCGGILGWVQPKADLRLDDPVQPLSKGISATVADLASDTITNTNNQESIGTSEGKVEDQSGPASENLTALSHHSDHTESSAEKSPLPISKHDGLISQDHPDPEKDEEPPSLPIPQNDGPLSEGTLEPGFAAEPLTSAPSTNTGPLSEELLEVEVVEAPSITSLSVDGDETDSALGDPSI